MTTDTDAGGGGRGDTGDGSEGETSDGSEGETSDGSVGETGDGSVLCGTLTTSETVTDIASVERNVEALAGEANLSARTLVAALAAVELDTATLNWSMTDAAVTVIVIAVDGTVSSVAILVMISACTAGV
jgi:hypothetical protein